LVCPTLIEGTRRSCVVSDDLDGCVDLSLGQQLVQAAGRSLALSTRW
jgi:hypothetical protein